MPRYIEENEIYKLLEPTGSTKVHCVQIDALPRANVASKREIARAIFDEIDDILDRCAIDNGRMIANAILELKAKYV